MCVIVTVNSRHLYALFLQNIICEMNNFGFVLKREFTFANLEWGAGYSNPANTKIFFVKVKHLFLDQ